MTQKILYCASTLSHIRNFHLPYLRAFHEMGYEVWVAADQAASVPYADRVVALPMQKKFLSPGNLSAVLKARKLIRTQRFDLVSTHTELASAIVRAGILLLRKRPKVVCTVHGYLFQENDGLKKWKYLIPEKLCARVTDVLMVMNHEDERIALRHKLYRHKLAYIHGMGIDLSRFKPVAPEEKLLLRRKAGISTNDFVFLYGAEFSERKNQEFLIRAFAKMCGGCPNVKLFLAGDGALLGRCQTLVHSLSCETKIYFLGHVSDMSKLYPACDICVSSSRIEGLPFNIMEALACGLPVLATNIKGHRELVREDRNGMLYRKDDETDLMKKMNLLYRDRHLVKRLSDQCRSGLEPYEQSYALKEVIQGYNEIEWNA
ncbi:putative glycosyltransferase EpsD [Caprobacter fermentans]|uniref:Putative glycosyltransferase EpsD n=1 Tax=Caproicibacter fermentans TaxID=2576756 RepID=A0A6N8HYD2_9FIRM|nr:glycosyltransferase family 4 protein [Caproicibacter fermentans]MVB10861.1 putative glycosyltransferase EpsD [Caproicibacter fermentans]